ncbi:MAG: NADH-quinone oxidoreductase subunit N [Gemmatimonadota bacterium]
MGSASSFLRALAPELLLAAGAMLLLLSTVWRPQGTAEGSAEGGERTSALSRFGAVLCVIVGLVVIVSWGDSVPGTVDQRIAGDGFRWAVDLIVLLGTALSLLLLDAEHGRSRAYSPEVPVLMLFAAVGMMILAAARDLMFVFLGVELMSLALYVLAGVNRRSARGAESAMKYFLLGSFSTGFLLYGMALLYGATGSTRLVDISRWVATHPGLDPIFIVGLGLLIVGFAFKVAAAPFHMWTPDVYDGAPLPITAFMASVVKTAGFATFARVMIEALSGAADRWHPLLWWLAALTMVVGNVLALSQRNLVRLLAYSSIAHAGYLLVAIVSNSAAGSTALLFYTVSYTLATIGAFGVLIAVNHGADRAPTMDDIAGLWLVRPGLAVSMAVFFLAFLGMPLVGGMGFFAKWYILQAAMQSTTPQTILVVLLVLTSVVSAAYYLAVISAMFMRPRAEGKAAPVVSSLTQGVVVAMTVALLVLGVYPTPIIVLARTALPQSLLVAKPPAERVTPTTLFRSADRR